MICTGYWARLRWQYRSDGYSLAVLGHEFDYEGSCLGMDMYDCADIPCAQVFPFIAVDSGSEDDLLMFPKLSGDLISLHCNCLTQHNRGSRFLAFARNDVVVC